MHEERLVETARELSRTLTPGDLDQTLRRITAAAVKVLPGVTHASITVRYADGRLQTVAPTDPMVCHVDDAQYQLGEGPCLDAVTSSAQVVSPYLATDERFPRYREVAVAAGLQSQAGVRLYEHPRSQGALNLYSTDPGSFAELGSLGDLFTHQSSMAIEYAQEIENLKEAIQTRNVIGRAVGIVMERYGFGDERAFAFLARLSQNQQLKLRVVAQSIVEASEDRAN
jgi:GAF domain-containing protein